MSMPHGCCSYVAHKACPQEPLYTCPYILLVIYIVVLVVSYKYCHILSSMLAMACQVSRHKRSYWLALLPKYVRFIRSRQTAKGDQW